MRRKYINFREILVILFMTFSNSKQQQQNIDYGPQSPQGQYQQTPNQQNQLLNDRQFYLTQDQNQLSPSQTQQPQVRYILSNLTPQQQLLLTPQQRQLLEYLKQQYYSNSQQQQSNYQQYQQSSSNPQQQQPSLPNLPSQYQVPSSLYSNEPGGGPSLTQNPAFNGPQNQQFSSPYSSQQIPSYLQKDIPPDFNGPPRRNPTFSQPPFPSDSQYGGGRGGGLFFRNSSQRKLPSLFAALILFVTLIALV